MSPVEYLKKNCSMAKKTVFWDFSRYACFFVMLILLQTLFSTVLILRVNNQRTQREYLESLYTNEQGYVYHAVLQGLSADQYAYVLAVERAQAPSGADQQDTGNYDFAVVGGMETTHHLTDGSTYAVYDLEIQFLKKDLRGCYNRFSELLFEPLEKMNARTRFTCVETPLLDASLNAVLRTAGTVLLIVFLLALSTLMLWVLRSTLTAHYRFTYGIYLSFGATFGRLFATAVFEMLILNVLPVIPSALIGHLAAWLIHRRSGLPFRICPGMALLSPAITTAASLIAAFIDFRRMASKPPVKLLASADNQDVISSPKTSANIFTMSFPSGVERLTRLRFRKYIVKLLAFALLFSTLSAGAAYLSTLVRTALDAPAPEYRLEFTPTVTEVRVPADEGSGDAGSPGEGTGDGDDGEYVTRTVITYDYTYEGEVAETVENLPGIGWVHKSCETSAADVNAPILIPGNRVKKSAGGVAVGDERGFLNARYSVLDAQTADALIAEGAGIDGSLDDVLAGRNMIAVSEGFNNGRRFRLKVGDKVRIAYLSESKTGEEIDYSRMLFTDSDDALRQRLNDYRYLYRTYTVGAVISGMATEGDFPVYLNPSDYTRLTGQEVLFTRAEIVPDPDAGPGDLQRLDAGLRQLQDALSNLTLTDLDKAVAKQVEENKNPTGILIFLAAVLLAASPLIWILSQTLFYLRRRSEMRMYLSIGANLDQVRKIFRSDGLFFALSGMGVYLLLSTGMTLLIHKLANNPYIYQLLTGESEAFFFAYRYPWPAILAGLVCMGICGLISTGLAERGFVKDCPAVFGGKGISGTVRRPKRTEEPEKEV